MTMGRRATFDSLNGRTDLNGHKRSHAIYTSWHHHGPNSLPMLINIKRSLYSSSIHCPFAGSQRKTTTVFPFLSFFLSQFSLFFFPPLFSVCLPKSSHKLRKQIGRGGSQQPHQTLHKMDVPRAIFSSSSRAAWVDIVLTVGCLKGEAWVARFLWVFSLGDGGGRCCWWWKWEM